MFTVNTMVLFLNIVARFATSYSLKLSYDHDLKVDFFY